MHALVVKTHAKVRKTRARVVYTDARVVYTDFDRVYTDHDRFYTGSDRIIRSFVASASDSVASVPGLACIPKACPAFRAGFDPLLTHARWQSAAFPQFRFGMLISNTVSPSPSSIPSRGVSPSER